MLLFFQKFFTIKTFTESTESRSSHHLRRAATSSKDINIDELKIDLAAAEKQSETAKTGNKEKEATGWRKVKKCVSKNVNENYTPDECLWF